jgi:hypothetical protein
MADLQERHAMDERPIAPRVHNILLRLSGRVDDSALTEARELSARLQPADAVELVIGVLIAGNITVTTAERTELAAILRSARSGSSLVGHLLVDDLRRHQAHRFCGDNQPEQGVAQILRETVEVLPGLRSVRAVWRLTPTGAVPGPLPQRVILVETNHKGNPTAISFRIGNVLRRAGIVAVVEVTGPTAEPSEYQEVARATAALVWSAEENSQPVPEKSTISAVSAGSSPPETSACGRHTAQPERPSHPKAAVTQLRPHLQKQANQRLDSSSEVSPEETSKSSTGNPLQNSADTKVDTGAEAIVELPDLDLDDPQLSERDRQLLRELRMELAEQASGSGIDFSRKGSKVENDEQRDNVRWLDGFSSN